MSDRAVSGEAPASVESLQRGILLIVLTGVVLGLGFNELGLASRPPHGLSWITQPKAPLASLEQLTGARPDASAAALPDDLPAPPPAPASEPKTVAAAKPAPPNHSTAPPAAATAPHVNQASAADPDDPLGGSLGEAAQGGLPDIPDLDRPLSVELPTVRKFVDAGAALILDAREPDDYAAGHIPGALNVPYDTAGSDPARLQALDSQGRPIIIYCGGGTCEVSMTLAETLIYQFAKRKVLVYTGGWPDWVAAGLPVAKGPAAGGAGR